MDIHEHKEGQATVLAPEGDLNTPLECSVLERRLNQLLESGTRCLVIDCTKTPRVSAAAIRLLLLVQRRVTRERGGLVLCGLGETVRRVFAISGFDHDFTIVTSSQEAVARATALFDERQRTPAPAEKPRVRTPAPEPPPPPPPSPVMLLAAEVADALGASQDAPTKGRLTPESLERLSAHLLLALAARRA